MGASHVKEYIFTCFWFFLEYMRLVFPSSREKISRLEIELPTTPFGFWYLSTILQ